MSELAVRFTRYQQRRTVGQATGEALVVTPEVPPELAAKTGVGGPARGQEEA
jgi:hypothetical protein